MKKKLIILLVLPFILFNNVNIVKAAEESFVPTITSSSGENSATISWNNTALPSKQLANIDYSSVTPSMYSSYNNPGYGEQSLTNGYIKILNNVNKGNSNSGVGGELAVNTSNYYFPNRITSVFGNNQKLLISMNVLTSGGPTTTGIAVNGGREQKLTSSGIYVLYNTAVAPLTGGTPYKLYVKQPINLSLLDRSVDLSTSDYYDLSNYNNLPMFNLGKYVETNQSGGLSYGYYEVQNIPQYIPAGTELKYRLWRDPAKTIYKTINTNGEWENFNFTVDLNTSDMKFFDINKLGVYFNIWNSVKGSYALNDDLKISIANLFWVYKDGAAYTATYDNKYIDTTAVDKAAPVVSSSKYSLFLNDNYKNFKWTCVDSDVGTMYGYKVALRNATNTANLSTSNTSYTTVKSGIKGFRYRITQNISDNLEEGYAFSNNSSEIVSSFSNNIDDILYLHIQPEDKAGNVGVLQHIKIDMKSPTLSITKNSNNSYNILASDMDSGIDYIVCPDGSKKYSSNFDYNFTASGSYSFIAYDKDGNSTKKDISVIVDSVSMTISNSIIDFKENTTTAQALNIKITTSDAYSLIIRGNDDFKTLDGKIIPLNNFNYKIGAGTYKSLVKGETGILDENTSGVTNKSMNLYCKFNNALIGYKTGVYNSDLTISLDLK